MIVVEVLENPTLHGIAKEIWSIVFADNNSQLLTNQEVSCLPGYGIAEF